MPQGRVAIKTVFGVGLGAIVLAASALVLSLVLAHREELRVRADCQAAIDRYLAEFRRGSTRAQVQAALDRRRTARKSFSGGMIEPGESTFQDDTLLATRRNHLCGTVVYYRAVFVYIQNSKAAATTDDPGEPLHRIYLEEADPCGNL